MKPYIQNNNFCSLIIDRIKTHHEDIIYWLEKKEETQSLPLYSSVDIRNSGFKMAVVDTNLFPAGFNNLCQHGLEDSIKFFRQAIQQRVSKCQNILIIAEEHTRNTWYLENIFILQEIIKEAGFNVKIATFLTIQPAFCEKANSVELQTATGQTVKIYCLKNILNAFQLKKEKIDLIILNNDLSTGIPEMLKSSNIPIYPSIQAGWHARLKSRHFYHTNHLIQEFSNIIQLDAWLFSCLYSVVDHIDINLEDDRNKLMDFASDLLQRISQKYQQHDIHEKPYIVLKSDYGTYGMGVMAIEDPSEIKHLNRKNRNKLYKGKNARIIQRYLLQEGVPTIYHIEQEVSEVCIYQIENNLTGGFYRSHAQKGKRDNLNSKGMGFKKMCPHLKKYADCGVQHDMNIFYIYRLLARIAGIAAHQEIKQLEQLSPLLNSNLKSD